MTARRRLNIVRPEPKPPVPVVHRLEFSPQFYRAKKAWKSEPKREPSVIDFSGVAARRLAFDLGIAPKQPTKWGWRSWGMAILLAAIFAATLGQGLMRWML